MLESFVFQIFTNFSVTKVKPFPGKVRQRIQMCFNKELLIGSFLENVFDATLTSKTNVVSLWKGHFTVFCKFLHDEVEITFKKSEAKCPKLFKSRFRHRKVLRKWFWSYLEIKNECCQHFERSFFIFLQIFEWRSWNHFVKKWAKAFKTI